MSKTAASYPPPAPPSSTADVSALLLEVLRNISREAQTGTPLGARAQAAVVHFQALSASLRTLPDGPAASLSGSGTVAVTRRA